MPRKPKTIPGPSRLSKILSDLKRPPTLSLVGVRALNLTFAARNDHFGARHFVKEDLPRIRFANPTLPVEVKKLPKTKGDEWTPELVVELENGNKQIIDMEHKWSTTILEELMDNAGGDSWQRLKAEASASGCSLFPRKNTRTVQDGQQPPLKSPNLFTADVSPPAISQDGIAASTSKIGVAAALP